MYFLPVSFSAVSETSVLSRPRDDYIKTEMSDFGIQTRLQRHITVEVKGVQDNNTASVRAVSKATSISFRLSKNSRSWGRQWSGGGGSGLVAP